MGHSVGHTLPFGDFYFAIILENDLQASVIGLVRIISKVRSVLRPCGCCPMPMCPFMIPFSGLARPWVPRPGEMAPIPEVLSHRPPAVSRCSWQRRNQRPPLDRAAGCPQN